MPRYETPEDIEQEDRIARIFATRMNAMAFDSINRKDCTIIDRVLIGFGNISQLVGFGEVKHHPTYRFRDPRFERGQGYLEPVNKVEAAKALREIFKVPCYLVVELSAQIYFLDMSTAPYWKNKTLHVPERDVVYPAVCFDWDRFMHLGIETLKPKRVMT